MNQEKQKHTSHSFWAMPVERFFINGRPNASEGYRMSAEHAHDYYEMVFSYSRIPIRYTHSGQICEMNTPSISFRAPYVLHSVCTEHTYVRVMLAFHPCILHEYGNVLELGRLRGRQAFSVSRTEEEMERLKPFLTRMMRCRGEGKRIKDEKQFVCLLGVLLREISELIPDEQPDLTPAPPYIQEMLHYIVEHTDENLTAEVLAKKYFVGKTKLAADFQAVTRQTLHEYVTAIRISRAKYWLAQDVPLSIIAGQCGFSQDASFIAMFRRETGMTPGQWREQNRT